VSFGTAAAGSPDIILRTEAHAIHATGDVPVLTLREDATSTAATPDSIYRYDRAEIMAAIAQAVRRVA
jgi:hypothetical protein